MTRLSLIAAGAALSAAGPAWAQVPNRSYDGYGHMMGDFGYGGYGMIWGTFFMVLLLAVLIGGAVVLVRWLGFEGGNGGAPRGRARDVLDMRFANGEIDAEEYAQRKKMLVG